MTKRTSMRSIPYEAWPQADRIALERALTQDDDGSGEYGQAVHLRKATLDSYVFTYSEFLFFLTSIGALSEAEGPGERVTPERVATWRRDNKLRDLAPTSQRQQLRNLRAFLRLLVPDRNWSFVTWIGGKALKRAIQGGPKSFIVRDVADVMIHVRQLHCEGLTAPNGPKRWQALRDAALLNLLLTRAPRVGSLVSMTMTDRHITLRKDGTWHLRFPGEHNKGGNLLDFSLDAEASRMLTDYIEQARPRFPRAGTTEQLWVGMKGPMTQRGFKAMPERRTRAWFGQAHGPHIFRKWLRASGARRDPALALDAANIMDHTLEVSVQAYAEPSGVHAALRHGDRLAERRARSAGRAERAFAEALARWEDE